MIRQLEVAEAQALFDLWLEGLEAFPFAFLRSADEGRALDPSRFEPGLAAGQFWGAFDQGELVGYACLQGFTLARQKHLADFGPFYVRSTMQGRGFGRALCQAMIDHARQKGFLQLELTVWSENHAAIRLYESLGFRRFGCRPRSVIIDGQPCDDLLMALMLDEQT
ncbi:GNAT family N-acetyltransferase [Donghicola mangrovi]|uniref:GNAT family N-acetyltransferase n=1 Tax=Donghicola mangrovi TaxID=2729614 RepID=A0A850Q5I4_9RHOB|nr:GNAT family N-acetyltransferase [Donghicola mangrovi]NVO24213.1 GNAT family N-acetyltransferase [Donghicola mangrovi]